MSKECIHFFGPLCILVTITEDQRPNDMLAEDQNPEKLEFFNLMCLLPSELKYEYRIYDVASVINQNRII